MMTFDPEGGDLGRAVIKPIIALEMQVVIPHVANILSELKKENPDNHYKYAFELHISEKDSALMVIRQSNGHLPSLVTWYEVDGKRLFEMRGLSGGVVGSYICYLVTR